jgi:hypothetical protein
MIHNVMYLFLHALHDPLNDVISKSGNVASNAWIFSEQGIRHNVEENSKIPTIAWNY